MHKTTYVQISLFIFVFILIVITFNIYNSDRNKNKRITDNKEVVNLEQSQISNTMENLSYSSEDSFGNQYKISAKKGSFRFEDKDIIFMEDVNAIINMNNSEPVFIKADFADYNNKNYDTFFKKNIFLNHLTHQISGEELNLLFKTNLVTMSDNLIQETIDTKLYADKFEMNLVTKDNKIFMKDKSQKLKILISK